MSSQSYLKFNYYFVLFLYSSVTIFLSTLIILGRIDSDYIVDIPVYGLAVILITTSIFAINIATFRDIISPAVLLSLNWVFPLYFSCLDFEFNYKWFDFFNKAVSFEVIIIFINAIVLFSLGALIAHRRILTRKANKLVKLSWNDNRGKIILLFSFSMGMLGYSYAVLLKGGIPIFSENVIEIRQNFRPSFWGNLFVYLVFVIIIAIARFSFLGTRLSTIFSLSLAITALFAIISSTARIDMIYATIVSGVLFVVIRRRVDPNFNLFKVFLPFLVIGIFFIVSFQEVAKSRKLNENIVFVNASPLVATYLAYGGPTAVKNFQRILDEEVNHPRTYGAFLLRPVLWFVGFRDVVDLGNDFKGPNTASWLYEYYCDFGILGVLIMPFLLGIFSERIYQYMMNSYNFIPIVVYGFVVVFIIISINNDRFFGVSNTVFLIGFIPLYFLYKYKFKLK